MGRHIILLSDGTGNSAAKLHKTNVWRVYQALDLTTDQQLVHYDDGAGTSSLRPLALIGGGFGLGLANNVRRLYAFLSRNYGDAQDKVFAFGFSRGAYTIRVLIGLVRNQGLVDAGLPERQFQREVLRRWDTYRRTRFREQQTRWLLRGRSNRNGPSMRSNARHECRNSRSWVYGIPSVRMGSHRRNPTCHRLIPLPIELQRPASFQHCAMRLPRLSVG